ncbi:MAG: anthranilate/aminodeoxychorismate synthase component II [Candidatus Omnitrophica bacterium CG1_02_46_14]|nr:MAG: anthranilate/aminodeoxychorismate synthase component II [Candidatus Omnitrophica bacterium CG1_02_46_14]
MILMIDNYDSFTYNLVQYFGEMGQELKVFRNDAITIEGIRKLKPSRIVVSPGPGSPKDAGISKAVIKAFGAKIPVLGVCLGHQCIGEVFGGKIVGAKRLMHGKTSQVFHDGKGLFKNIDNPFVATRYHSLLIEKKGFPKALEITAWTKEQEIMGLRHKKFPIVGVQFHPESILTQSGKEILRNFLERVR